MELTSSRRQLATRHARWAETLARGLVRAGIHPNAVSMAGVGFALAAGVAFALAPGAALRSRAVLLFVAAAAVQLRLLCNLLDGMLAIEGGLATKTGEIYNDLPDRISDVVILVGAGYAVRPFVWGVTLGWTAAVLALSTAYVRVLGGSLGVPQRFLGPMAKQHRMFTLTVAAVVAIVETVTGMPPRAIGIGLAVIAAGSIVTTVRRLHRVAADVSAGLPNEGAHGIDRAAGKLGLGR